MIEVGLPFHFAFEADALYSRLGNTFVFPFIANSSVNRTIANAWVFPLLAKYRFQVPRTRPFVSLGLAPRHATGRINTIHYGFFPSDITFSSVNWHATDRALVLSGGIEVGRRRVRIVPEIRYYRRAVPTRPSTEDIAYYLQPPHTYEAQFLLGIKWGSR
jgi:hypothetical protein